MANIVLDFLHNYQTGERRETEPANAYQYDEGHVLEAVLPEVITSAEIHYWIRGMEEADAYTPTSITPNSDGSCTVLGNIPNSYFETNGELRIYIVVTDGTASITTYEGKLHICQRSMPDDYVDDDPENESVRVITEARAAAATATQKAGEAAASADQAQEILNSIPEDYSQLSEDVSDLNDEINELNEVIEMPLSMSGTANPYGVDAWSIIVANINLKNGVPYTFSFVTDNVTYSGTIAVQVSTGSDGDPQNTIISSGDISNGAYTLNFTPTRDYEGMRMRIYGASSNTNVTASVVENSDNAIERMVDSINSIKDELNKTVFIDKNGIASGTLINTHGGTYVDTPNNTISVMSAYAWDSLIVPCNGGESFEITGIGGSGDARLFGFLPEISSSTTPLIKVASAEQSSAGLSNGIVFAPTEAKWAIFNLSHADSATNKIVMSTGILNDVSKRMTSIEDRVQNHIRFMVFGNSYGMDSITYVPFILKDMGITCEIYLYRRDACTLRDIYNRWESADATDTETDGIHAGTYSRIVYRIDTRTDTSWRVINRISMKDCVELGGWDFITLQQWSAYSIDATTYTPWLPLVIDKIRQSVDGATMLAWTQVCTRASHDDQQASLQVFKELPYGEYPFDFYIPYGTAIFNARANATLAELGDYSEHNFWKDGIHLQDGLPRYIAALTVCEAICRKFFPKKSVMYDKTRPTSDAISSWGNDMPMTPSVGITEENCLLAQYSAINACNHMFEIIPTKSLPSVPST